MPRGIDRILSRRTVQARSLCRARLQLTPYNQTAQMPKKTLHVFAAVICVAASAFAHAEPDPADIESCVANRLMVSPDPLEISEDAIRLNCLEDLIRSEEKLLRAERQLRATKERLGFDKPTPQQEAEAEFQRELDASDAKREARIKALNEKIMHPDERVYDPVMVAFVVGLIVALGGFASFLYRKEANLGWRRVSILSGAVAFPAAVLTEFGSLWVSLMGLYEFYVLIATLIFVPMGMLLVLLTRRVYMWLQDGFAKSA